MMMKTDDTGRRVAVTLDEALAIVMDNLRRNGPETDEDRAWVSHATGDGADRGERTVYLEITSPEGLCEGFRLSLTREDY